MEPMTATMPEISILVVEDEAITLEYLVTTIARKFPAAVLYKALNGRKGLELFEMHAPEIVITDVNMPEMGGVEMSKRMHEIEPDTKFVVLSGTCDINDLQDSVDKGFEFGHLIVKPVDFQELFDAIEQCVGEIAQHQSI